MSKRKPTKKPRRKRTPAAKGLTLKQQRFVIAFVGEAKGNATEAARLAGYRCRTAQGYSRIGEENKRKPEVAQAIEVAVQELQAAGMATAVETTTFLTRAMRAANHTLEQEVTAAHVEAFSPLWNVGMNAAAQLVKVHGLAAPKKIEHSGSVELPIALTPELEAALDEWLIARNDPRVQAVLAELRGES